MVSFIHCCCKYDEVKSSKLFRTSINSPNFVPCCPLYDPANRYPAHGWLKLESPGLHDAYNIARGSLISSFLKWTWWSQTRGKCNGSLDSQTLKLCLITLVWSSFRKNVIVTGKIVSLWCSLDNFLLKICISFHY